MDDVKLEFMDTSPQCRICLLQSRPMKNLYDINAYNRTSIADVLERSLNIKVPCKYKYPNLICNSCEAFLNEVTGFIKMFEHSQNILNSRIMAQDPLKEVTPTEPPPLILLNAFRSNVSEIAEEKHIDDTVAVKVEVEEIEDLQMLEEEEENEQNHYVCYLCEKSYSQKSFLIKHLEDHKSSQPIVCQLCNKTFRSRFNLKTHMLTHEDDDNDKYKSFLAHRDERFISQNGDESLFASSKTIDSEQNSTITLSEKSKAIYKKHYALFTEWCKAKNIGNYTEKVLLSYFIEKSNVLKPSSLWSIFSMLKSTIASENSIDIGSYQQLLKFLKVQAVGYVPQTARCLKRDEIHRFLVEAPDERYLMMKVALVMGIAGACRRDELVNMSVDHIEDKGSVLIVKILNSKNIVKRSFTVVDRKPLGVLSIYRKYLALRPANSMNRRLFVNYRNGRCTVQVVGINTIAKIPKYIAQYLNLSNSNTFTGHCFRKTSLFLAKSKTDMYF